jgi:hypothetical protein
MKKIKLDKTHVDAQFLTLIVGVIAFLIMGYSAGTIVWMQDFQYFVGLISGLIAIFVGVLALLRFYTHKSSLNFLFLGIGFIGVGILELFQILTALGGFSDLFNYTPTDVYPLTTVISKTFLALLFFISWFVSRNEGEKSKKYEKFVMYGVLGLFVIFTVVVVFVAINSPMSETLLVTILGIVSLMLLTLAILGYLFNREWKYDNFDFWVIFSLSFAIVGQIFYLPLMNIEYSNLINISAWASFISYLGLLVGFLNSIYELYAREMQIQNELKETKNKIENAYMVLRKEKWDITKKKGAADKILKDVIKSK